MGEENRGLTRFKRDIINPVPKINNTLAKIISNCTFPNGKFTSSWVSNLSLYNQLKYTLHTMETLFLDPLKYLLTVHGARDHVNNSVQTGTIPTWSSPPKREAENRSADNKRQREAVFLKCHEFKEHGSRRVSTGGKGAQKRWGRLRGLQRGPEGQRHPETAITEQAEGRHDQRATRRPPAWRTLAKKEQGDTSVAWWGGQGADRARRARLKGLYQTFWFILDAPGSLLVMIKGGFFMYW